MILDKNFFDRDCLDVAPDLIGKIIIRRFDDGSELRVRITETEAYRGEEDKACHASKGRTPRTELLYGESGLIYIYLCYGIHWLMNVVTGGIGNPQGVLFRAGEGFCGPARLTKFIQADKKFNAKPLYGNPWICIEDDGMPAKIVTDKRVGIDYAGEEWINKLWRFKLADA